LWLDKHGLKPISCCALEAVFEQLSSFAAENDATVLVILQSGALTELRGDVLVELDKCKGNVHFAVCATSSDLDKLEVWVSSSDGHLLQTGAALVDEIFRIRCINNFWLADVALLDLGTALSQVEAFLTVRNALNNIATLAGQLGRGPTQLLALRGLGLLERIHNKECLAIEEEEKNVLFGILESIRDLTVDFEESEVPVCERK